MVKTAGLLGRWMTTANESCERRRLHRSTITPDCHSGSQPSTTHRWIGQRVCKRGVNCIRFTARAASAPLSRVLAGAETLSFGPESWLSSGCRVPSLGALQNRLMQGGSAQRHRKRSTRLTRIAQTERYTFTLARTHIKKDRRFWAILKRLAGPYGF